MFPLPVCERIVSHISIHRRHDLHTLLLTDKTFHAAAEPIFYSYNVFTDVHRIHLFTQTLTKFNPRLALHVRTFGINLNDFFYKVVAASTAVYHSALLQVTQQEFWDDVRVALSLMERLKTLVLVEMTGLKISYWTRILDSEHPYPFALEEVKLHLTFDDHLARFLNAQAGRLRVVRLYNTTSDEEEEEDAGGGRTSEELVLPDVDTLDISISLAPYIRPKSLIKLTHLQLFFDSPLSLNNKLSPSHLFTILSNLIIPSRHLLRGLSLLELPHRLSTTSLFQYIIKLTNTTLCHVSHLHLPAPYPSRAFIKSQFLACLIEFPRLSSIELSLDSWDETQKNPSPPPSNMGPGIPPTTSPPPTTINPSSQQTDISSSSSPSTASQFQLPSAISQKALISELKTFCPTLRTIVLWYGKVRMRWVFISDDLPFQLQTTTSTKSATTTTTVGKRLDGSGGSNAKNETTTTKIASTTTTTSSPLCHRIENAAMSGDWHYRVEDDQWAGYSRLWRTC